MLYVETNNSHEQMALEQQFSREGNLFGVPIKKTSQITRILQTLLFEIFQQQPNRPTQLKRKACHPLSKLIDKLLHLFDNILKLTFSLSQIRQIFEIIKTQSTKISLYEEYIQDLTRKLDLSSDEEPEERFHANYSDQYPQEYNQVHINRPNNQILEVSFTKYETKNEPEVQSGTDTKMKDSMEFIQSKYDSPADEDAQTMHTLKSEITSSPKFSLTPSAEAQLDKRRVTNCRIEVLQNSLHYSQDDRQQEEEDLINVKDQYRVQTSTHSIFYCPEWKKNEDDQKAAVKNLAPSQPKKTSSNDSNYIENLSGRVHPVPSFLHDDSLGEMIVRQKKEDVRKSIILKKSMHGIQQNKIASNQYTYSSNLRMIKFHNKLRRNSKKSLGSKKDIDQLKSAKQELKQADPTNGLVKGKNINFASDDKILRPKEQLRQPKVQNLIIQSMVDSKLNFQKKTTEIKPKTRKNSNFFKSHAG